VIIECEGLSKRYRKTLALNEVSLKLEEGVTGLIGPNGAGKSTLIKLILGMIKPTGGKIRVFGLDPWTRGESVRKRVGVLHEKPIFPGWATGIDLLELVGKLRGVNDLDREIKETLTKVGMWDARNAKMAEYSAGMVQRLGIAQAIIGKPEMIILDEPTANLDPKMRAEALEILKAISEEGSSMLISTHILPELERVCESVTIIEKGTVIDNGLLESLAEKYYAYSFTIKSSEPKELMETLSQLKHVRDVTLRQDEVSIRTSNPKQLMEWLDEHKTNVGVTHVREETGLLERIYFGATKQDISKNEI
jgi:ABC-type multidrug transport system ATPase subunit